MIVSFLWDVPWRLLAMWHAARQNQKVWFVALLLINSVGIVPLIYLVFVSKIKFWEGFKNQKDSSKVVEEAEIVKKRKK